MVTRTNEASKLSSLDIVAEKRTIKHSKFFTFEVIMGLAYEEYCDAMYEREYCMSDIDFGCQDCSSKERELESYSDGYDLFRNELEKIDSIYTAWYHSEEDNKSDIALLKVYEHLLKLFNESGYETNAKFLKAVI